MTRRSTLFLPIRGLDNGGHLKQYSVLGAQATGKGCTVNFEEQVYRDEASKKILYEITVVEEGACDIEVRDRNLILVPQIPSDYSVDFSIVRS